jgi:hypothetical protein
METLYIWLLVFGGASLLLLGMLLFASVRRSGKRRRQVDTSRHKLRFSEIQPGEKLREKVPSRLSRQGEEGQSMVEKLQADQPRIAAARCDNDELQGKIANLIKQLHASERRLSESTREVQRVGQRNLKLEAEVAHLKQQLKASQTRQQQLLNQLQTTRSPGMEELSAQTDAILQTPADGQQTADELRTAENLAMSEHPIRENHQPLRNDHEEPVSPLEARTDALRGKKASLASRFSRPRKLAVPSLRQRNRPFGVISATAAIAVVGTAMGLVSTSSDNGAANLRRGARASVAESPATVVKTFPSIEPAVAETIGETAPQITETVGQAPPASAAPLLGGTFETIRATGLFTGPSEESALIRTLVAGTKIDVVDARDGWLEVRSRHATSGFLRQEAAVRVGKHRS